MWLGRIPPVAVALEHQLAALHGDDGVDAAALPCRRCQRRREELVEGGGVDRRPAARRRATPRSATGRRRAGPGSRRRRTSTRARRRRGPRTAPEGSRTPDCPGSCPSRRGGRRSHGECQHDRKLVTAKAHTRQSRAPTGRLEDPGTPADAYATTAFTLRSMAITTAAEVADLAGALPAGIAPERGVELYRFIREHRPRSCLELGVGHGVSALYIGAALEANGAGTLTTVDRQSAQGRTPPARDVIEQAGLSARIDVVYEATSYTWFLHDALRAQLAADGRVEPRYDFVFIDGAHTWDVDALAFSLTDRLLRPGGWLLFDDLDWRLDIALAERPAGPARTGPGHRDLGPPRRHPSRLRHVPQRRPMGLGTQVANRPGSEPAARQARARQRHLRPGPRRLAPVCRRPRRRASAQQHAD